MVLEFVEVAHADFTKITRVIFIHEDSVVVLTTRHTATGRMFAMLANSTVTGGDVSALLAVFVSDYFEKRVGRESFVSAFVFVGMGLTKENDEIDSRGQRHPPPIAHNRSRTKADDIRATKFRPRLKKPPNVLSYPREYRFSAREKTHIFFSHKLSLKGSFQSASTISEKMKFANGSSSSRTDATDVSTATKLPRTKHKKYEKKSQKNDT
jgi:hypothetical protein